MTAPTVKEVLIQGITTDGKTFRPSDWAERLAGVMSQFRPGGVQPGSHLGYSIWCVPNVINEIRCVVVNPALREYEPMAWDFVMNFANDNHLVVTEICILPEPKS
jgi:Protein of unknown function (DUF3579)